MHLKDQLRDARTALGKAIKEGREAATKYQTSKSAEDLLIAKRTADAATELHLKVQTLESDVRFMDMEAAVDPVNPSATEQLAGTRTIPAAQGDAGRLTLDGGGRFIAGARQLTVAEHQKRFGASAAAHSAAMSALIRLPGSYADRGSWMRECAKAACEAMGVTPSETYIHKIVDDSLGGFLVSEDFRAQLIRALPGYTVVRRSGARVINTNKTSVKFPVVNRAATNTKQYTSDMIQGASNWKQEALTTGGTARTTQSKPTFGMEEIPVHLWQPDPVEITAELLDDADIDLDGLFLDLIAETMGQDTDFAFLKGTGQGTPEGILNGGSATIQIASAATYATPNASAVGGPDNGFQYQRWVNMFVGLAAQYRQGAVWYLNSDTFGRSLGLSGSDGHPLFPINAIPGTLLGRPMYFTEFLDTGATQSTNFPVIFGDPRYYVIAERRNLAIQRLVERFAPNIALQASSRIGGQVVLPEAFRIGTVGA